MDLIQNGGLTAQTTFSSCLLFNSRELPRALLNLLNFPFDACHSTIHLYSLDDFHNKRPSVIYLHAISTSETGFLAAGEKFGSLVWLFERWAEQWNRFHGQRRGRK